MPPLSCCKNKNGTARFFSFKLPLIIEGATKKGVTITLKSICSKKNVPNNKNVLFEHCGEFEALNKP
jgi:hypothetical protein